LEGAQLSGWLQRSFRGSRESQLGHAEVISRRLLSLAQENLT
jgi:hypothetical protein